MANNSVSDGVCQIEILVMPIGAFKCLYRIDEAKAISLVPEGLPDFLFGELSYVCFASMAKGRVTEIVSDRNGADQFSVQSEVLRNRVAHCGNDIDMFDSGANMIILGCEEYLGLVLQTPIRCAMKDSIVVACECTSDIIRPTI